MKWMIKDIHAHAPNAPEEAIANIRAGKEAFTACFPCSIGLHPWDVGERFMDGIDEVEALAGYSNVMAIGEAGIDRLCGSPVDWQIEAFERQVLIAEACSLPLIVHNVKATAEIIAAKRRLCPVSKWIVHGFRGKPQLAGQLLEHGFVLSFGEKFNAATVVMTPMDMMLCETDESKLGIDAIRSMLARAKGMDLDEFNESLDRNIEAVFLPRQ